MKLAGSDIRLLRVFEAVVKNGGFAAAQGELNISQSTISNHITALEQRLGVTLCQRGRGGFRLTDKGKIIYDTSQRMLGILDELSSQIGTLKGNLVGNLKVGIVDAIATDPSCLLHKAFEEFLSLPNDITMEVFQESPQNLQQRVLDGDLHIGIGSFPHKIPGLSYDPIYDERHSLYCGQAHSFFNKLDIPLETLQKEPFAARGYWREQLQKDRGFYNVTATVYQIEPQLILIRSGKMIGYLPDHFAAPWVESGALARLRRAPPFFSTFDIVTRKGGKRTQMLDTFHQKLKDTQYQG